MPRYEVTLVQRVLRYRKVIVEAMTGDAAAKKAKSRAASEPSGHLAHDSGWGEPMDPKITTHSIREIQEG